MRPAYSAAVYRTFAVGGERGFGPITGSQRFLWKRLGAPFPVAPGRCYAIMLFSCVQRWTRINNTTAPLRSRAPHRGRGGATTAEQTRAPQGCTLLRGSVAHQFEAQAQRPVRAASLSDTRRRLDGLSLSLSIYLSLSLSLSGLSTAYIALSICQQCSYEFGTSAPWPSKARL
eukprot:SAG31_NODE_3178_length_4584_cov_7.885842_4_plen_173_part_00